MKKFKLRTIFLCIILGRVLISCSDDDFNATPVTFYEASLIYSDSAKLDQFVNNIYSSLSSGYNRLGASSMLASSTDEAVHATRGSEAELWGTGSWDANLLHDDLFGSCYTAIRKTFIFEEQLYPFIIDAVMTPSGRNQYIAQVFFLRAFFNFELLKRYGGYPLVKKTLSPDEDLNLPRNTYDDCVYYIVDLCDQAAEILPVSYDNSQFGHVTKGAALALKAKVLLYAASPLFNDPTKLDTGLEHGYYEPGKWEDAAKAAAAVINLKYKDNTPVYSLYPSYQNFFYTLNGNKEIILSKMSTPNNTVEKQNGPVSITGGEGGTCPTLDLVDDYEMKSGIAFDWNNPEHAAAPFANRDPRFEASILYNGATWMNNMLIETYKGGKDAEGARATRTGFYLRKFCDINAQWIAPIGNTLHCFPLIRYGEVLLNYSEAMNEAYGPDVDPKGYGLTARDALKLIRERAGIIGNTDLFLTVPAGDKVQMRNAVRHERRIELAFEEHRHLDVRRWKIAETVFNRPVSGLNIVKNDDGTITFTRHESEIRVFSEKMYLYPFSKTETRRNGQLIQNTGW